MLNDSRYQPTAGSKPVHIEYIGIHCGVRRAWDTQAIGVLRGSKGPLVMRRQGSRCILKGSYPDPSRARKANFRLIDAIAMGMRSSKTAPAEDMRFVT